jgi:hypothetical protein
MVDKHLFSGGGRARAFALYGDRAESLLKAVDNNIQWMCDDMVRATG